MAYEHEITISVTQREYDALRELLHAVRKRMERPGPQTELDLRRQYDRTMAAYDT